jgi:predicted HAD superfamily Cof-like phosphohydrolase
VKKRTSKIREASASRAIERAGGGVVTRLRDQLFEFHEAFGHHIGGAAPAVPPEEVVRLRARLIIEEACEALEAMFFAPSATAIPRLKEDLKSICCRATVQVNLPALADALGDTDYVVEGTRVSFGIDGLPVAEAIHAANMAKLGGGKDAQGKSVKPDGWKAPDIARVLRRQGWKG